MNKRISYVTLVSDIYTLLAFSFTVYSIFFGLQRIGNASFTIVNIEKTTAIIIAIIEILFSLIMAYLLHKCSNITVRIVLMVLCILNIIYRVINLFYGVNPLILLMIFINLVLLIILLLYKKSN